MVNRRKVPETIYFSFLTIDFCFLDLMRSVLIYLFFPLIFAMLLTFCLAGLVLLHKSIFLLFFLLFLFLVLLLYIFFAFLSCSFFISWILFTSLISTCVAVLMRYFLLNQSTRKNQNYNHHLLSNVSILFGSFSRIQNIFFLFLSWTITKICVAANRIPNSDHYSSKWWFVGTAGMIKYQKTLNV